MEHAPLYNLVSKGYSMNGIREVEVIQHTNMNHLEVFLVEMTSRESHGHDDLEIGMILKGNVTLFLDQHSYPLQKGDIYILNRHQVHSFSKNNSDNLILAFQVHTELYKQADYSMALLRFETPLIPQGPFHDFLAHALLECASFYFGDSPFNALKCSSIILNVLYCLTCNTPCHIATEKESSSAYHNTMRLKRITNYISEHYTERISLQDIAALENITDYHASHFIKKMMGMSFQEYVNQLRFAYALTLIRKTNLNILDICMETGFSSSRYLNQMFLKNFGCTAKEYLKMPGSPHLISNPLPIGNIQKRYTYEQAAKYLKNYLSE